MHKRSISTYIEMDKKHHSKLSLNHQTREKEEDCISTSTSPSSLADCPVSMKFLGFDMNDLFEFGEYIETLIKSLRATKLDMASTCLAFWSFNLKTNLNSVLSPLLLYFDKDLSQLSESYFKTLLLTVLIGYDCSFNTTLSRSVLKHLNQSLIQLHRAYLVFCDYLILHISLNEELASSMKESLKSKLSMTSSNHIAEITNAMKSIFKGLDKILDKYINSPLGTEVLSFYENLSSITISDIDLFFQGEVNRANLAKSSKALDQISFIPLSLIKPSSVNMVNTKHHILPPFNSSSTGKYYTLVLDLDETLIHFVIDNESEGRLLYRPYLFEFLKEVSRQFEVVVYTASVKEYADIILNLIEGKVGHKVFDYRLYREHTTLSNKSFIKDLSRLGRDLSRVLIVDNLAKTFEYQKENGVLIAPFLGQSRNDRCLIELSAILNDITHSKASNDVREHLRFFSKEINRRISLKKE